MDGSHRLKELLQLQLASDAYAVLHLPFVLDTLRRDDFQPSAHTPKWIARINSLIHSRDPAARWSGLCFAFQTATFSRDIMLDCAQSWVGAAIPLLVNQPPPTMKAAMRLLRLLFSSAMDVPEFQRQVCIPNVPKFVNALIAIAEQDDSHNFLPVIESLTHIVSLYPSLCRQAHTSLANLALRHLNGSAPNQTSSEHIEACSRLYAVLPLTGGKVIAPNLWRKSLDDTIAFAWGAFLQLRTTYLDNGSYGNILIPRPGSLNEDPVIAVPLALDRLRAAVRVIGHLLSVTTSRPVLLPIGSLVRLCSALLQCTIEDKCDAQADNTLHALEKSVVPTMWKLSADMLTFVAQAGQHHLTPHLPALLTCLAHHLEQTQAPSYTLQFLRTVLSLLADGSHLHDDIIASRLARATMPLLTVILSKRSQSSGEDEQATAAGKARKGKKRARVYEGDELFKVGREIVCVTPDDGNVLLVSADVLESLLIRTRVTPPVHSIASRLLLSIYGSLPQLSPAILSSDLSLHPRLYTKLQRVCVNLAMGTTRMMSKSLALVLTLSDGTLGEDGGLVVPIEIDLLLRPRMPPLVRSLPQVEMMSLFRTEESQEEMDTRKMVGVDVIDEHGTLRSDVADPTGPKPQDAVQTALSSGLQTLSKVATNTGMPAPQETSLGSMRVDVPSSSTPPAANFPGPSVSTTRQQAPHPVAIDLTPNTTLPPPPDQLPFRPAALGPPSTHAPLATPIPAMRVDDDDGDEPMPTIDLSSDSDPE